MTHEQITKYLEHCATNANTVFLTYTEHETYASIDFESNDFELYIRDYINITCDQFYARSHIPITKNVVHLVIERGILEQINLPKKLTIFKGPISSTHIDIDMELDFFSPKYLTTLGIIFCLPNPIKFTKKITCVLFIGCGYTLPLVMSKNIIRFDIRVGAGANAPVVLSKFLKYLSLNVSYNNHPIILSKYLQMFMIESYSRYTMHIDKPIESLEIKTGNPDHMDNLPNGLKVVNLYYDPWYFPHNVSNDIYQLSLFKTEKWDYYDLRNNFGADDDDDADADDDDPIANEYKCGKDSLPTNYFETHTGNKLNYVQYSNNLYHANPIA